MRVGRQRHRSHIRLSMAVVGVLASLLSACGSAATGSNGGAKNTITVAYEPAYVFFSVPEANWFMDKMIKEFQAVHPGVQVKLEPVEGSYNDMVNKLSLLLRTPSTAPDVAELPGPDIGLWSTSGYLLALNKYLGATSWWAGVPAKVKAQGSVNGNVYAVDENENVQGLFYNVPIFRKAGIPVPWHPTSWQDIVTAAKKVKAADPSVIPLWLLAGTESGANGMLQGINNLIVGSSDPTIETAGGKVVVDSSGLRESLQFYKEVYQDGLGADTSLMFSPTSGGPNGPLLYPTHKLAICLCSNGFSTGWSKQMSAPYFPQAQATVAVTPIPHITGGGIATDFGGFQFAVSSHSHAPSLAFDFINLLESQTNEIIDNNYTGGVPPNTAAAAAPGFTDFFPPYNRDFAQIFKYSVPDPSGANYTVWAQGMGEATGAIINNPQGTTVAQAINILKSYVTNQLGSGAVTTQP